MSDVLEPKRIEPGWEARWWQQGTALVNRRPMLFGLFALASVTIAALPMQWRIPMSFVMMVGGLLLALSADLQYGLAETFSQVKGNLLGAVTALLLWSGLGVLAVMASSVLFPSLIHSEMVVGGQSFLTRYISNGIFVFVMTVLGSYISIQIGMLVLGLLSDFGQSYVVALNATVKNEEMFFGCLLVSIIVDGVWYLLGHYAGGEVVLFVMTGPDAAVNLLAMIGLYLFIRESIGGVMENKALPEELVNVPESLISNSYH
jgi:hypothetical protein